jgi:hypothetical protein
VEFFGGISVIHIKKIIKNKQKNKQTKTTKISILGKNKPQNSGIFGGILSIIQKIFP